jgi:Protein of unknown function DUF86
MFIFDAVRIRMLEIGEAVKALPAELLSREPDIPWKQVAGMRNHLAHCYFDTNHAVLRATVDHNLPELDRAIERLRPSRCGFGTPARRRRWTCMGTCGRTGTRRHAPPSRPRSPHGADFLRTKP